MTDSDSRSDEFEKAVEALRVELVREFGAPGTVPARLREAYLAVALTGQALAYEPLRSANAHVCMARRLQSVRVIKS